MSQSQGAQGGIVLVDRVLGTQEFGCDSSDGCGENGANGYHLRARCSWTGLMLDGVHDHCQISLHREMITPNIVDFFGKHAVPPEPDITDL